MINGQGQKRMLEYLADKLSGPGIQINRVKEKYLIDNDYSRCLYICDNMKDNMKDNKMLFMIDREYDANGLQYIYDQALSKKKVGDYDIKDLGFILYKDNEQFFRSNARNYRLAHQMKSGQPYINEVINKMILFSQEEQCIHHNFHELQYYQPESKRLDEGVRIFTFKRVIHNVAENNTISPRHKFHDHYWINSEFLDKNIKMEDSKIISA